MRFDTSKWQVKGETDWWKLEADGVSRKPFDNCPLDRTCGRRLSQCRQVDECCHNVIFRSKSVFCYLDADIEGDAADTLAATPGDVDCEFCEMLPAGVAVVVAGVCTRCGSLSHGGGTNGKGSYATLGSLSFFKISGGTIFLVSPLRCISRSSMSVKLKRFGNALPFGSLALGSLSSSKKGCVSASSESRRLRGSYTSNFDTKSTA